MLEHWKLRRRLKQRPGWGEMPMGEPIAEGPLKPRATLGGDCKPHPAPRIVPEGQVWYRLYLTDGDRSRYVDGFPTVQAGWEALGHTRGELDEAGVRWRPVIRIETEEGEAP